MKPILKIRTARERPYPFNAETTMRHLPGVHDLEYPTERTPSPVHTQAWVP